MKLHWDYKNMISQFTSLLQLCTHCHENPVSHCEYVLIIMKIPFHPNTDVMNKYDALSATEKQRKENPVGSEKQSSLPASQP